MSAALRLEPQARIFNVSGGASKSPLQNRSTREFLGSLRWAEGLQPEVAEPPVGVCCLTSECRVCEAAFHNRPIHIGLVNTDGLTLTGMLPRQCRLRPGPGGGPAGTAIMICGPGCSVAAAAGLGPARTLRFQ